MTEAPASTVDRRFYLLSPDMRRNPSDCEFVNNNTAFVDGRRIGSNAHPVPGHPHPIYVGVPALREKPKLVVGHESSTLLDIYGFGMRFVSTQAKELLSSIDRDAFEFAECDTVDGNGVPIEPYWLMDVVRVVARFDEARSRFIRYVERFPNSGAPADDPFISQIYELRMPADFPDTAHAFYLLPYQAQFVLDGVIADAWRSARLKGCILTPLQQPTKQEFREHLYFVNYPYWTEKGRAS